jgi:hypothetical protein
MPRRLQFHAWIIFAVAIVIASATSVASVGDAGSSRQLLLSCEVRYGTGRLLFRDGVLFPYGLGNHTANLITSPFEEKEEGGERDFSIDDVIWFTTIASLLACLNRSNLDDHHNSGPRLMKSCEQQSAMRIVSTASFLVRRPSVRRRKPVFLFQVADPFSVLPLTGNGFTSR